MSNDDYFDIDSLRVIYDIDRYPDGADIFDYDAEAIRWNYPGLLPLLLFECYVFRHDTSYDEGEWECLIPFVEQFNSELSDILSTLGADREYAARLLLGMNGSPVKPENLNEYIENLYMYGVDGDRRKDDGCEFASKIWLRLRISSKTNNSHYLLRAKNKEFLEIL